MCSGILLHRSRNLPLGPAQTLSILLSSNLHHRRYSALSLNHKDCQLAQEQFHNVFHFAAIPLDQGNLDSAERVDCRPCAKTIYHRPTIIDHTQSVADFQLENIPYPVFESQISQQKHRAPVRMPRSYRLHHVLFRSDLAIPAVFCSRDSNGPGIFAPRSARVLMT